jgi:hypothetical protein
MLFMCGILLICLVHFNLSNIDYFWLTSCLFQLFDYRFKRYRKNEDANGLQAEQLRATIQLVT